MHALDDKSWKIRGDVALALGKIGDNRAVEPLIYSLKNDKVHERFAMVGALGEIGGPIAVKRLVRSLHDEDWKVRVLAARALGKI